MQDDLILFLFRIPLIVPQVDLGSACDCLNLSSKNRDFDFLISFFKSVESAKYVCLVESPIPAFFSSRCFTLIEVRRALVSQAFFALFSDLFMSNWEVV